MVYLTSPTRERGATILNLSKRIFFFIMVEKVRIELTPSALSEQRSNQLSYFSIKTRRNIKYFFKPKMNVVLCKILRYPSLGVMKYGNSISNGWTGGARTHDLRLNRPLLLPTELPSNINKAVNHQKALIFYIFIINLLEILFNFAGTAFTMVREVGLEPTRRKAPASKAGTSSIPSLPHICSNQFFEELSLEQ